MRPIAENRAVECIGVGYAWSGVLASSNEGRGQDKSRKVRAVGWGASVNDFNRPEKGYKLRQKARIAPVHCRCWEKHTLRAPQ